MNLVVTATTDCIKDAIVKSCKENFTINAVKITKSEFDNLFENFTLETKMANIDDIVVLFNDTTDGREYYKLVFSN